MAETTKKSTESQAQPPALNRSLSDVVQKIYSPATQEKVAAIFKKIQPLWELLGKLLNAVGPYVEKFIALVQRVWKMLEPYHPEEWGPALFGLFTCFFGGLFLLTLGAIEAYRVSGWEKTKKHLIRLRDHYYEVKRAYLKDSQVDADNDGIADVHQIGRKELVTRKLGVLLRSTDPDTLRKEFSGVWLGFIAVVATLRSKFAQTLALGATIGDVFFHATNKFVAPLLVKAVPAEYRKWIPFVLRYACRAAGASIAFFLERIISGFYSSIRGAQLFTLGLLAYLNRHHYLKAQYDDSSLVFLAIVGVVAAAGFWWQLSNFFTLPFPLSLVFWPVGLVENFLFYFVAVDGPPVASA